MICLRVIPFRCDFPGAFFIMGIYYRKVALMSIHFATFVYNPQDKTRPQQTLWFKLAPIWGSMGI